jgi:hypothetical protein
MPETDFEKERRLLRELEGKNVSNYRVLLTALIRTTMENVRVIVTLSAAGIGLTLVVLLFGWIHGGIKFFIAAGAFLGFFVSLVLSLGILERNAQYLTQSLKGGSEKSLDIESCGKGVKKLFLFGCLCLIALGLVSALGPRWKHHMMDGKVCPFQKMMKKGESEAATPATAAPEVKKATNGSSKPAGKADPVVSQETSKAASVASVTSTSGTTATTGATATVTKPSGNGGNFKSGRIY